MIRLQINLMNLSAVTVFLARVVAKNSRSTPSLVCMTGELEMEKEQVYLITLTV